MPENQQDPILNEFMSTMFAKQDIEDESQLKSQPNNSDKFRKFSELAMQPQSGASAKMPSYIGTKIVCATPMAECKFLTDIKKQDTGQQEDRNGYLVVYEDGYKSWSPKETFERSYRLITDAERRLV